MKDPANSPEKPVEPNRNNQRLLGALLAFLPSIIILLGYKVSNQVNPFASGRTIGLLCGWILCCYLGSRMIFRPNSVLVAIYSFIFFMINVLISLFIGCAQGTVRIG